VTRVDLVEGGEPVELPLDPAVGAALAASQVVTATPSLTPGWWTVGPAGKVGVAELSDVEVWIRPKLEIRRLVFLVGYALNPKGWQNADVPLAEAPDLLTAVAYAFVRQADRALQQGLLQGYRTMEEALPVLRGRVRESDQMRTRHGLAVPLEVRYDEFTVDIAENQLLRAATEQLLRLPRVHRDVRHQLTRLLLRLADVSPLGRGQQRPVWHPSRLNARYHIALRLADLVLEGKSFEQRTGAARVNGFLFDMPRIFEDFVCVALREALTRYGGRTALQDRHHLDEAERVRMRPDLVWHVGGLPRLVVDAKYKAEKPAGFPDVDLYQMLAYCTALGLRRGHLVYAEGNELPARHVVRNACVEIVCHALDLDQDPRDLIAQVHSLADELAAPG
jgi:5-methylcytosine-specific restriction enzyme subunit McrC